MPRDINSTHGGSVGRASSAPIVTTTPRPPVNLRNTDQLWPIAASKGATIRARESLSRSKRYRTNPYVGSPLDKDLEDTQWYSSQPTGLLDQVRAADAAAAVAADVDALGQTSDYVGSRHRAYQVGIDVKSHQLQGLSPVQPHRLLSFSRRGLLMPWRASPARPLILGEDPTRQAGARSNCPARGSRCPHMAPARVVCATPASRAIVSAEYWA